MFHECHGYLHQIANDTKIMSQTSGLEGRIEGNKSNSTNRSFQVFQVFLGGALLSSKITQEPPSPRRLGKGQWFPSSNLLTQVNFKIFPATKSDRVTTPSNILKLLDISPKNGGCLIGISFSRSLFSRVMLQDPNTS